MEAAAKHDAHSGAPSGRIAFNDHTQG
jgi:hypothetical protein